MDNDAFYIRLANALGAAKFKPRITATAMLNSTVWIPTFPLLFTNVEGAEKSNEMEEVFAPMCDISKVVAFRFVLGQPMVVVAIEADNLSSSQARDVSSTFNQCISQCAPYTLKLNTFGRSSEIGGLFGYVLFTFFDTLRASDFLSNTQSKCSFKNRKPVSFVHPWVIDVAGCRVIPDIKPWFDFGSFTAKKMAIELFGNHVKH